MNTSSEEGVATPQFGPKSALSADVVHFIGIGGIGMSALASMLLDRGVAVTGSERAPSALTEQLKGKGAEIFFSHRAGNLRCAKRVIYGSAIPEEHPELCEAKRRGLPIAHRSALLGELMRGKRALLVTGTHGKTTTAALLAHLLECAGRGPSFAIGGIFTGRGTIPKETQNLGIGQEGSTIFLSCTRDSVREHGPSAGRKKRGKADAVQNQVLSFLGYNGHWGRGSDFVAEADESDGSFLHYAPFGAIITNCGGDHLDHWKSEEALCKGFEGFARKVESRDSLFWCGDDARLRSLNLPGFSYGFGAHNALQITESVPRGWKQWFSLAFKGKRWETIPLALIGEHNVLNAAAVFGLGMQLGIEEKTLRHALETFPGTQRRMEFKGERAHIRVFDDYGHHPHETQPTIAALKRAIGTARLVVAFQPHRYSRTQQCVPLWSDAFRGADMLVLTDIYAAGEAPIAGVDAQQIGMHQSMPHAIVPREQMSSFLVEVLQPGDVLLTLGAGDITQLGTDVLEQL